jgi:hypothetical protein
MADFPVTHSVAELQERHAENKRTIIASIGMAGAILALGFIWHAASPGSVPTSVAIAAEPIAVGITPLDVARYVFAGFELISEDNYNVGKKTFRFRYQDESWHSLETARHLFLKRTRDLVPLIFKQFPEADSVLIEAYADDFVDIRGNVSNGELFAVQIDRNNSDSTNWKNVKLDNIMKFADTYYQHPSVTKNLDDPSFKK